MIFDFQRVTALDCRIVRLFNCYGPHMAVDDGRVVSNFIVQALQGQDITIYGDGQQTRCFCYVGDTVEALVRLQNCLAARGQVFNVGGTEEISMRNLAHRVIEIMGSPSSVELVPYNEAYEPGFEDMRRRKPVVDKLAGTIGFHPCTPLHAIIERAAAAAT